MWEICFTLRHVFFAMLTVRSINRFVGYRAPATNTDPQSSSGNQSWRCELMTAAADILFIIVSVFQEFIVRSTKLHPVKPHITPPSLNRESRYRMWLYQRQKAQKCYRMGWKVINLRNKLWFMWWQTIISGASKRFIANNIKKWVSSGDATVSPVQPVYSKTLLRFHHTSFPPIAYLRTTCLFAGLSGRKLLSCVPHVLSVFTSSLCNCLRIRAPGHSLCNKRWRLVILVDYSVSTLRFPNSVYIAECQLISREIILW